MKKVVSILLTIALIFSASFATTTTVPKLGLTDTYTKTYKNIGMKNKAFRLTDPLLSINASLNTYTSYISRPYKLETITKDTTLRGTITIKDVVSAWKGQRVLTTLVFFNDGKQLKTMRFLTTNYAMDKKVKQVHDIFTLADEFDEVRITQRVIRKAEVEKDLKKYDVVEMSLADKDELHKILESSTGFSITGMEMLTKDDIDILWSISEGYTTNYTNKNKYFANFGMHSYVQKGDIKSNIKIGGTSSGIATSYNNTTQKVDAVTIEIPDLKTYKSYVISIYDAPHSLERMIIINK